MKENPKLYIALPIIQEFKNLPLLFDCLNTQTIGKYEMVVCVNNYNKWWDDTTKTDICLDNQKSIEFLKSQSVNNICVIDKSSKGFGWSEKKGGVGWARKVIMDEIANMANDQDIIVSIDADTYYPTNYLSEIHHYFNSNPDSFGLSLPYYHKSLDENTSKLILRYEIYMRYYLLNMLRINNPYAFTALGSAMAFPVWAYKKVGGLTPFKSGEDFYFLQKLVKNGNIGLWADTIAYPSSRFSGRVLFGTGPALIKGSKGDWRSYPVYDHRSFNLIEETFGKFQLLFEKDLPTPMDSFLTSQSKDTDLWGPLRKNYKDQQNFINACIRKVDGLRILQFLRYQQHESLKTDEHHFFDYLSDIMPDKSHLKTLKKGLSLVDLSVSDLESFRNKLFEIEMEMRKSRC